jgi:hypothetical protein
MEGRGYCFFSGAAGVTGCEPPVDFGPGVTPALFSVEPLGSLAAVVLVFGLTPLVGPLPASFVDATPLVGPLPASPFGCANAEADRPRAMTEMSKVLPDEDIGNLPIQEVAKSTRLECAEFQLAGFFLRI